MRMAVVDVGSHTVRLEIADGDGAAPLPVRTSKHRLRLSRQVEPDGRLPIDAVKQIVEAVADCREEAVRWGAEELYTVATAVVRHAPNRDEVCREVEDGVGVPLGVLSSRREAELTFLAARRWMGWRAGPMVLLDIGGGSLEVAFGRTGMPDFAASARLGAARVTRQHLAGEDPPPPQALKVVRREVRHQLRDVASRVRWESPSTAVATSRTFQQLARLCGASPGRKGPFVPRTLSRRDLKRACGKLARLPAAERASLPGITGPRAEQSLGGALVAETTMGMLGLKSVAICPWALREGILLHRLEGGDTTGWTALPRSGD